MDSKNLYICISNGNPDYYLTFNSEVTDDINQAAKCVNKTTAKYIIEDYKKEHNSKDDLFFVPEVYLD